MTTYLEVPERFKAILTDDIGIKYERQEDIKHLFNELKTIYKISEDWGGKLYCGLNLE